jgi:hypothetical protein
MSGGWRRRDSVAERQGGVGGEGCRSVEGREKGWVKELYYIPYIYICK